MKVYLIIFDMGYDGETVDSVWSTQDLADKEMERLTCDLRYSRPYCSDCYRVDEFEVKS